MEKPTFRNPGLFQVYKFRDWIRDKLPNGPNGCVVEDLDLVIRVYGPNFHSDGTGKFMLIELKFWGSWIQTAQKNTFGLIDHLLRRADPNKERYLGYFVINYNDEDWDQSRFSINHIEVSGEELMNFLLFKSNDITGLWDN
jgi:hypothetical protein